MLVPTTTPSTTMLRLRDTWRLVTLNRKVSFGLAILAFFVLLAIFGPMFFPGDPNAFSADILQPPSPAHWLGTTQTGQDVLTQLLWGTRFSLIMGFAIGISTMIISVIIGLVAGYFGGLIDEVLSLFTNVFLVLPTLPLAILLAAFAAYRGPLTIAIVLIVTGWSWGARLLRAQKLEMRTRDFIVSAKINGKLKMHIIIFDIIPYHLQL